MKLLKYFTPILLSVSLCACGTDQTATVVQPITVENIAPTNVAKADTTTIKQKENPAADLGTISQPTETPEAVTTASNTKANNNAGSNSAIKSLTIDGNGTLVATNANGTFTAIGPVQGVAGPAGPMGPKGDKGDRGADGQNGQDGRGIDHCQVDENNHLIVYYTDNTSQDAGAISFQIPTQEPQDYEKVGYTLNSPKGSSFTLINDIYTVDITNFELRLVKINDAPASKYEYNFSFNYTTNETVYPYTLNVKLDNTYDIESIYFFNNKHIFSETIYSSMPYVNITDITFE